jgi:hypothetical protein
VKAAEVIVGERYVNAKGQVRLVADETPPWLCGRGLGVDDYILWVACHGADAPERLRGTPVERHGKRVTGVTTRRSFASWACARLPSGSVGEDGTGTEESDFIDFADVAHGRMRMQTQYAARFLFERGGAPFLGAGIRVIGTLANYHEIKIHRADAEVFVARYEAHTTSDGVGDPARSPARDS